MANHIEMATARSILSLRQRGWSYRRIARALGIHRETVARHVSLAEARDRRLARPRPAKVSPVPSSAEGLWPAGGNPTSRSLSEPCREVILRETRPGTGRQAHLAGPDWHDPETRPKP